MGIWWHASAQIDTSFQAAAGIKGGPRIEVEAKGVCSERQGQGFTDPVVEGEGCGT